MPAAGSIDRKEAMHRACTSAAGRRGHFNAQDLRTLGDSVQRTNALHKCRDKDDSSTDEAANASPRTRIARLQKLGHHDARLIEVHAQQSNGRKTYWRPHKKRRASRVKREAPRTAPARQPTAMPSASNKKSFAFAATVESLTASSLSSDHFMPS